jgi:hypothetical protein
MHFLNPTILPFLALAAIPVVIHMLYRPKPKLLMFPSLIFLTKSFQRSHSMFKLKHFVLMAMRVLAVALFVLALARPDLSCAPAQSTKSRAVAVIIDDSFRMRYTEGNATRFALATGEADEFVRSIQPGTEVVLLTSSKQVTGLTLDSEAVRSEIRNLAPTFRGDALATSMDRALSMLKTTKAASREIHVFTDCTRSAWRWNSQDGREAPAGTEVRVHRSGSGANDDMAVVSCTTSPAVTVCNQPTEISATVLAGQSGGMVTLELFMDGEKKAEKSVTLGPNDRGRVSFLYTPASPGNHQGYVALQAPDPLEADNTFFFSLNAQTQPKLLIVNGAPSTKPVDDEIFYLQNAICPPGLGQKQVALVNVTSAEGFSDKHILDRDIVILANVPGLSAQQWNWLKLFTISGGGIIVFCGDRVVPENYRTPASLELMPCTLKEKVSPPAPMKMKLSMPDHFIAAPFKNSRNGDIGSPLFKCILDSTPVAGAGCEVPVQFSNGSPGLAARKVGSGLVLLFASTCDVGWTNFPKQPCYVPFIHQMIRHAYGCTAEQNNFAVGDVAKCGVEPGAARGRLLLADAAQRRLADLEMDTVTGAVTWSGTDTPGNFEIVCEALQQNRIRGFSVNLDAAGLDMGRLADGEIASRLAPVRTVFEEPSSLAQSTIATGRRAKPHEIAMMALLVLMAAELLLSNRMF